MSGYSYDVPLCCVSQFTGKERDSETGLDYFGARYYGSNMGRFASPDEFIGGPIDVFGDDPTPPGPLPYADITDPQSLNMYSYTYNRPLILTDPDGHCPWCVGAAIGGAVGFVSSIVVQKLENPSKAINWKGVAAATVGGAVAGATMGLASPAAMTTLSGTTLVSTAGIGETVAVGATGGIVGGVAERAVNNNGDLDAATQNLGEIGRDALAGGGGEIVNQGVGKVLSKVAGGAVAKAEQKVARLTTKSSSSTVKARTSALKKAQQSLQTKTQSAQAAASVAVTVVDQTTRERERK